MDYAFSMVSGGAAFRLVWNEKEWDLSNVDIYHIFDSDMSYRSGIEALGREFEILGRDKETKKEEFIQFIKKHIDEGYPCIALGIIGPPEACLITGYRDNGETLLGWNFFQDDPDFAGCVRKDENGYFVSDKWWENPDTQAVMCMGPIIGEKISEKQIINNAKRILSGRKENAYCKGIDAYAAWAAMLGDDKNFGGRDIDSVLFEKLLCQTDAMACLLDGRGSAAAYFYGLAKEHPQHHDMYEQIAASFSTTRDLIIKMSQLFGGWEDVDGMLKNLEDENVRRRACEYIVQARESDEESLRLLTAVSDMEW